MASAAPFRWRSFGHSPGLSRDIGRGRCSSGRLSCCRNSNLLESARHSRRLSEKRKPVGVAGASWPTFSPKRNETLRRLDEVRAPRVDSLRAWGGAFKDDLFTLTTHCHCSRTRFTSDAGRARMRPRWRPRCRAKLQQSWRARIRIGASSVDQASRRAAPGLGARDGGNWQCHRLFG